MTPPFTETPPDATNAVNFRSDEPAPTSAVTTVAAELGPVNPGERIAELDILRGFALLGIGVINIQGFLEPGGVFGAQDPFPETYNQAASFLVNLFGSGKFNAMFSFLFGVGFALQMDRAAAKQANFVSIYVRRLVALFLFGVAHATLLWDGDVLHLYAGIGLPLIFCRKLRDRWLWLIAFLCLVVPIARFGIGMYLDEKPSRTPREIYDRGITTIQVYGKGEYSVPAFVPPPTKEQIKAAKKDGRKIEPPKPGPPIVVSSHSTYPLVVKDRTIEWLRSFREGVMWFWPVMGTTLVIGFIAGRRGVFQNIPAWLPFIKRVTIVCGIIGFLIAALFATAQLLAPRGKNEMSTLGMVAGLGYVLGRPVLCAFYMGVLILVAQTARWRPILAPLASVGRMPLTNYLMQSVVFSTLFYGYGLGLFYRVGPAIAILIAFATYAVQVVYSNWWMERYRFGPAEWLWRTLTYGKPPAMTIAAPVAA